MLTRTATRCLGLTLAAAAFHGAPTSLVSAADSAAQVTPAAAADDSLFDSHLVCPQPVCVPNPCPPNPCPPNPCYPHGGTPNVLQPDQVFQPSPSPMTPAPQSQFANQPATSLSAGQGAISGQDKVAAMFGDFFAGPSQTIDSTGPGVVALPRGGAVGVMKFAENTSPLPRDRFFLNYSYFDDVNLIPGKMDVRRLTPGFEKTMFDGVMSLELRVPMATTLNSTTMFDADAVAVSGYDTTNYELGNVTGFFKALLFQNEVWAFSTGLGIALPTADDQKVINDDGSGQVFNRIENEAVHLLPFFGVVATPTDKLFMQAVVQFDAGLNGNSVYGFDGNGLIKEGKLDDPNYIFVSLGGGYWIYESEDPSSFLSRIALVSELHFNNTLGSTDSVEGTTATYGQRVDIQTINAVVGSNIVIDQNKSVMLGYVQPIGGGNDRAFDGEFRAILNWYFGPALDRQRRVQF